jgi:glycosyltransferase involved in cell wall biosynthesis
MHLAVDAHNLLEDRRGIGVYVRALLSRFARRGDLTITLLIRAFLPRRFLGALRAELGDVNFAVRSAVPSNADVVWHPWNGTFFLSNRPSVATIHDCTPFAFPAADARARESQQAPFRASASTARRVLTDSAFSRGEIHRWLAVPGDRIDVVPLAADPAFGPGAPRELPPQIRRQYLLFVGADDARKNLAVLTGAWRGDLSRRVDLVCVGCSGGDDTIALRGLSTASLCDVYRGALALAVPSTYEGFGLPALEAMASGTPVVCSRVASLPEVCGDAARYVDDPLDVEAWRIALGEIVGDDRLRASLGAAGLERAEKFSWDRCAQETLAVLDSVAQA